MSIGERRSPGPLVLRARYVFPVAGEPIADGFVTIDGNRIVAVGRWRAHFPPVGQGAGETPAPRTVRDLGNVAILPGLVNAHTHLDFSHLTAPLGEAGIGFVDWLRRVMDLRRQPAQMALCRQLHCQPEGNDDSATIPSDVPHPVMLGLHESLRGGVTALGDIAQPAWPVEEICAALPRVRIFQELIAPTADRVAAALNRAQEFLAKGKERPNYWHPGLSPHAPFSVCPELLTSVIAMSAAERIPLAMHLAESREELELLRYGTGPLRAFLTELEAWDATVFPQAMRPLDYLRLLASAGRTLVIHGNYLDDEEIAFLAAHAPRMTVVYCPRTHDWFAHAPYPLEKMLAAGVSVALGTDGRGSTPDLSLLAELRFVAQRHAAIPLGRVLRMGTILGARALGWETEVGSLEPGKRADLAIVALPDRDVRDPHELLFDSTKPLVECYCRGVGYASA